MSEDREETDVGWSSTARRWYDYIRPFVHRLVMWQRWEDEELPGDSDSVVNKVIESSLQGNPIALRCRVNDQEIIMAAHPIVSRDTILGGVVVEQNIADILAFQRAPASGLTPFTYIQLVWAILLGWLIYGQFPDVLTLVGIGVIAASGLFLAWHERRRARGTAVVEAPPAAD